MSRFQAVFPDDRSEINLSPMLDVVFIMLIFFIVVATFIREQGIDVALPHGKATGDPEVTSIVLTIESPGVFNINGSIVSRASVMAHVQALHGKHPKADYVVRAANKVPVSDTAVAVDAGRRIGEYVVTIMPIEN